MTDARDWEDLEPINAAADELNAEAEDVLDYQASALCIALAPGPA